MENNGARMTRIRRIFHGFFVNRKNDFIQLRMEVGRTRMTRIRRIFHGFFVEWKNNFIQLRMKEDGTRMTRIRRIFHGFFVKWKNDFMRLRMEEDGTRMTRIERIFCWVKKWFYAIYFCALLLQNKSVFNRNIRVIRVPILIIINPFSSVTSASSVC